METSEKHFYLDKIRANIPEAYEFACKHYDVLKIDDAGHSLNKKEFNLRIRDCFILTKEMITELTAIEKFSFVYVSRYSISIVFNK